jgi:hypothetical protein
MAIDGRTTRHAGYVISQKRRKRIEESFGWMKTIGMLKKVKLRGLEKVSWLFTFVAAVGGLIHSNPATAPVFQIHCNRVARKNGSLCPPGISFMWCADALQ